MDGVLVWDGTGPAGGVTASEQDGYVSFTGITGAHTWAWSGSSVIV